MSLFGAIVKTVVNIVKLPVALPLAAAKDLFDYSNAHEPDNVARLIRELKEETDDKESED